MNKCKNGTPTLKPTLFTKARSLTVAALLALGATPSVAAEPLTTLANLQSGVQSNELLNLYMRDLARANCPALGSTINADGIADAIFSAELRSGLEAVELDRLHATAEAMVSDPAFCARAASLPALPSKAG